MSLLDKIFMYAAIFGGLIIVLIGVYAIVTGRVNAVTNADKCTKESLKKVNQVGGICNIVIGIGLMMVGLTWAEWFPEALQYVGAVLVVLGMVLSMILPKKYAVPKKDSRSERRRENAR